MKLPITSPYTAKDQKKANGANKFIGWGTAASSTRAYAIAYGDMANTGEYTDTDTVFVSVEGARSRRIPLSEHEVILAANAGVTFHTDGPADRWRPYNVGEREVAELLQKLGYREARHPEGFTVWKKP
jgi:hypothetical protein